MTSAADINPKTLELIAALNALATNEGATEHEAQTAMEKMQALLFKHNLELAEVLEASKGKHERPAGVKMTDTFVSLHRRTHIHKLGGKSNELPPMEREWRYLLMAAIARSNFVSAMTYRGFGGVWLIGTAENIEAVKTIWTYACEQVEDLSYDQMVDYKKTGGWDNGRTWRRGWLFGCVERVDVRLWELWMALRSANEGSTALVVNNGAAISEYVKAKWFSNDKPVDDDKKKKARKVKGVEFSENYTSGYTSGRVAGDRIDINRPSAKLT